MAKVLRFCGPPLKMKRGLMIPKHLNAWMNESSHHINQSLRRYLFDFWPTRVAKVVHVSSLMKGIVRELRLCYWHLTLLTNMGTYLLTFRRWMQVRHSFWPDFVCIWWWCLEVYWVEGCLEKQNSRNGILGCFESSCVYMAEETSGWGELWLRSIYENNMKMQCNLTFNATLNTKP